MKSHFTKIPLLILASSLLFAIFLIVACRHNQAIEEATKQKTFVQTSFTPFNSEELFSNTIILNRLPLFIQILNRKSAHLKSISDFQIKAQDPFFRKQLTHQTSISIHAIILHFELANLINSGLSEIDAQILHFSHSNYQDPFTSETFNSEILATANPESILMNIQGFLAGNLDPIAKSYHIDLSTIESWIQSTKQQLQPDKYASSN